jgi:luciferase family oxidoreductase group 1
MRLSIVELATVAPGTTEADGLADAILTAQDAEALGFHRAWFAEHHLSRSHASHHPELLIAMAGARTTDIRVGSGSVLLNHYSPFKVAEMFQQLEAMLPGRVDLGLGRATGGPVVDAALRIDRRAQPVDDHAQRVSEVLAWLHQAFPARHPFADQPLMPSVPHVPQTWLLGSSPGGSALAAGLGNRLHLRRLHQPPSRRPRATRLPSRVPPDRLRGRRTGRHARRQRVGR